MAQLFDALRDRFARAAAPLAERMRPRCLDEVVGQRRLLAPGGMLREALRTRLLPSMILWGPPGCGKTTIARLLAREAGLRYESLSATSSGVRAVRELANAAAQRIASGGARTLLFLDEIHRFSRSQQDALLPPVESGAFVLVGATTENPSFEVIPALRSRARVLVLDPLSDEEVIALLERALQDRERGLGALELTWDPEALEAIALASGGDARAALQLLELSVARLGGQEGQPRRLDRDAVSAVLSAGGAVAHDKGGEAHFDTISALHKSIRGSDPDAALYWLARMLEGGEDPLYIARRLVRAASEDVGLADPQALVQANAAAQAVQLVGLPEGALALAQACVYLALAPKSDALYRGYGAAQREVRQRPAYPVPLALRNAPTALLRRLGYGQGYRNPHEEPEAVGRGPYLPEALEGRRYYVPTDRGLEHRIGQRLASIAQARARLRGEAGHG